jgi:two-component system cell cycle sensor histidine kinase/response regulator CckA
MEQVLGASERAAALTRQLLAFSRKQVLSPKMLDLKAIVAQIAKMLPHLIGEDVITTLLLNSLLRLRHNDCSEALARHSTLCDLTVKTP